MPGISSKKSLNVNPGNGKSKMDNAEIAARLDRIESKVDKNTQNIAALLAQTGITPMIIKWVVFPLVSILAAGFGLERVIGVG